MKKSHRIIALVLMLTYLLSLTAFAAYSPEKVKEILDAELKEELKYIDDVYKYDLDLITGVVQEDEEEEVFAEELKYEKAVNVVDALGLIKRSSDGYFREDEPLSADVFCSVATVLMGAGDDYATEAAITHAIALDTIMKALGCEYAADEAARLQLASRKDVLLGITYNREKFITRGEAAQMIYNALCAEVNEIGNLSSDSISYKTTEGYTLLSAVFGMEEVAGLVTGANGIDIYANRTVPEDTVEINRVSYMLSGAADTSMLLGQRVYALVDMENQNKVVYLGIDKEKESVLIPFNSITELGTHIGWEVGDNKGKTAISGIKYVTVNGDTTVGSGQISQVNSGEGTILLGSSDGNKYDVAVISKYQTLVVNRISTINELMYFNDGLLLNGQATLDISDEGKINVTKDGVKIAPTDVASGDVITAYVSSNGAARIEVSTRTVKGKIESMINGRVVIKDKEYEISSAYNDARTNGALLPELTVGTEATFLLNSLGQIAYVKDNDSAFNYGVVKAIRTLSGGLEKQVGLRIFNYDGEWVNYMFKDGAEIDGVPMSLTQINDALIDITDRAAQTGYSFLGSIVRYTATRDDRITALDTIDPNASDASDSESLHSTKLVSWEGELAWTKGRTLSNSTYGLETTSTIFYVPTDLDDEEAYGVLEQKSIPGDGKAKLILYNPDDYFRCSLAVYTGSTLTGNYADSTKQFLVETVAQGIDDDGNEIVILRGYDSTSSGVNPIWKSSSYALNADFWKTIQREGLENPMYDSSDPTSEATFKDIKPGDLFWRNFDANGDIGEMKLIMFSAAVSDKEYAKKNYAQENFHDELYGEIVSVDPARGRMLVNCDPTLSADDPANTLLFAPTVKVVAIFDGATGKVTNAQLGDAIAGDKVQLCGGWASDNAVIYRNCEGITR